MKVSLFMGTGITIIPYIDPSYTSTYKDKENLAMANDSSNSKDRNPNFEETLVAAKKAVAAVAIDKLVAGSKDGSVDAAEVQSFFNQNGININFINMVDKSSGNTSATATPIANTSPVRETISNTGLLECSEELQRYFEEAAKTFNVDVKLLKSVAFAESSFDPTSTSPSGAMGIMQLMPATAEEYHVEDPYDPYQSIMGGAELLAKLLDKYDNDKSLALAAYNAGPGNVEKYGGIPPFEETQNYVRKVLDFYNS